MKPLLAQGAAAFAVVCLSGIGVQAAHAVYTASAPEAGKPIIQCLVAAGMTILCLVVIFKNAKRTHQD